MCVLLLLLRSALLTEQVRTVSENIESAFPTAVFPQTSAVTLALYLLCFFCTKENVVVIRLVSAVHSLGYRADSRLLAVCVQKVNRLLPKLQGQVWTSF